MTIDTRETVKIHTQIFTRRSDGDFLTQKGKTKKTSYTEANNFTLSNVHSKFVPGHVQFEATQTFFQAKLVSCQNNKIIRVK
jgi:hypothetical protein